MTKAIDLGALFADTELPFGHPVRNFDESPAGYSDFDDRYEPPPIDPPEEEIIHYGPGNSAGPGAGAGLHAGRRG